MKILNIILIIGGIICICTVVALSNTIIVPDDQPTIQAGINSSSNGDTVLVSPGIYVEFLDFNGKSIVVISSDGAEHTFLSPPTAGWPLVIFDSGEDSNTVFAGFTISGSTSGPSNTAIYISSSPVIRDNIYFRCYTSRVVIECANSNPLITRNVFIENGGISCVGIYSGSARIMNNTFHKNNRGFFTLPDSGYAYNNIISNSTAYGVYGIFTEFDYNNVWNNGTDYDNGAAAGEHDISADPVFVDSLNHDYHILYASPCIDAGNPEPEFNDPDGSRNDIGAYPYHAYDSLPAIVYLTLDESDILHVLSHTPAFQWLYYDTLNPQLAYEFEVGTDNDWSVAEMWETGTVFSADTFATYAGLQLEDGATYYCRARAFNGNAWSKWKGKSFRLNSKPEAPVTLCPPNNAIIHYGIVKLMVSNCVDGEQDNLTYDFELYDDENLLNLIYSEVDLPGGDSTTSTELLTFLDIGYKYWWRSRVYDGYEYSDWSTVAEFTTRGPKTTNVPGDFSAIQAAIDLCGDSDTILVAPGTYFENINFLGRAIKLMSTEGSATTIIEPADGTLPIILFENGEDSGSILNGFTIKNTTDACGIKCIGSGPIIQNCDINNCSSGDDGGGIYFSQSSAIIRNNLIHDNQSSITGGGIGGTGNAPIEIAYNQIYNNYASSGPGIGLPNAGNVYIHHNILWNNTASHSYIAAIYLWGGTSSIINNTIVDNSAGIYIVSGNGVHIYNNIVANNLDYGIIKAYSTQDYNNLWNNEDYDNPGPHGISCDPLFVDAANADYSLSFDSPCIDMGDPDSIYNDPDGTRNDMGAIPLNPYMNMPIAHDVNMGEESFSNVVSHQPIFYWTYYDTTGAAQIAYEIDVGTDFDWTTTEMWSSGVVYSTVNEVQYNGGELIDSGTYYFRIKLCNDAGWGDWHYGYFHMNVVPSAPISISPINMAEIYLYNTDLAVENATDFENDELLYDFEIFEDTNSVIPTASRYNIAEQPESTVTELFYDLPTEDAYWWRCRAYDGFEHGGWSEMASFNLHNTDVITVTFDAPTIQDGIFMANRWDTVLVAPGYYYENIKYYGKEIVVLSEAGPEVTIIEPENCSVSIVTFENYEDSFSVFNGFTVTGTCDASGIRCYGGSPIIKNCIIHDCERYWDGAGIYCISSSAKIRNCLINNNTVTNEDKTGGAIFVGSPGATEENPLEIAYCDVYGNESIHGPGIGMVSAGYVYIHHNLIRDNVGSGTYNAGIYSQSSNCRIINNTIARHQKGIYFGGGAYVQVLNNIIAYNPTGGIIISSGNIDYNNIWGSYIYDDPGPNGINEDPLFLDINHILFSLFYLSTNSPCVDAGHPDPIYNDPDGSRNDMGAFPLALSIQPPLPMNINLGAEDPLHVQIPNPIFYWYYFDTAASSQSAYEIEVGTDLNWDIAEMWATGTVSSSNTSAIFSGNPLDEGINYYCRIRLNNGSNWGDWITINFRTNSRPDAPLPFWPPDNNSTNAEVFLAVENAYDREGDVLIYDFAIYYDPGLTIPVESQTDIVEGTRYTISELFNLGEIGTPFWWQCRAFDGYLYSEWSEPVSFTTYYSQTIGVPDEIPSIQTAIDLTGTGDTIIVAAGEYSVNLNFKGKSVTLLAAEGKNSTFLVPRMPGNIVYFINSEDSNAVLDGFTIMDALDDCGIFIENSGPIIQNCEITDCYNNDDGGGIICRNSNAVIRHNVIHNNSIASNKTGGGIFIEGEAINGELEIAFNKIYENEASHGSGIGCPGGGDIYVHHNIFYNNIGYVVYAGAIYLNGTNLRVINNTAVQNSCGIHIVDGSGESMVLNNLIVQNTSGIIPGSALLDYCNVWDNGAYNNTGPNGISEDPLFADASANNYYLQPNSPCIDAGHPDTIYNDPDGTRNDIGALPYVTCGDVDNSGAINLLDITFLINFLYKGGPAPSSIDAADVDNSGAVNILDITYLISYLYKDGPEPVCS